MRRLAVFILMMAFMPCAAWADTDSAVCQFLPTRQNVQGADYVPGVDVHGQSVVPADVTSRAPDYIDVIRFPVTLDLARQLSQDLPEAMEMNAPMAMIEIHHDGFVEMNGHDLSNAVYAYCNGDLPAVKEDVVVAPEPAAAEPESEEIIWGEEH